MTNLIKHLSLLSKTSRFLTSKEKLKLLFGKDFFDLHFQSNYGYDLILYNAHGFGALEFCILINGL